MIYTIWNENGVDYTRQEPGKGSSKKIRSLYRDIGILVAKGKKHVPRQGKKCMCTRISKAVRYGKYYGGRASAREVRCTAQNITSPPSTT